MSIRLVGLVKNGTQWRVHNCYYTLLTMASIYNRFVDQPFYLAIVSIGKVLPTVPLGVGSGPEISVISIEELCYRTTGLKLHFKPSQESLKF